VRHFLYTYWEDGAFFIGHLNDFPEYETQGLTKEELEENLKELASDLESSEIPYIRRIAEIVIA
jgi:predicted RNase H-like HicB family nuclease